MEGDVPTRHVDRWTEVKLTDRQTGLFLYTPKLCLLLGNYQTWTRLEGDVPKRHMDRWTEAKLTDRQTG